MTDTEPTAQALLPSCAAVPGPNGHEDSVSPGAMISSAPVYGANRPGTSPA